MNAGLRRPILISGLGVTGLLWLFDSLHPSTWDLGETGLLAVAAIGIGKWWLDRRQRPAVVTPEVRVFNRAIAEQAVTQATAIIEQLGAESPTEQTVHVQPLQAKTQHLAMELDRTALNVGIVGSVNAGKQHLKELLSARWSTQQTQPIHWHLLPDLMAHSDADDIATVLVQDAVYTTDLVVYLIKADLTGSEMQHLQSIVTEHSRVVLVLDLQVFHTPDDQQQVMRQVRSHLKLLSQPVELVTVNLAPAQITVRQQQEDGTVLERIDQPDPDVTALSSYLNQLVLEAGQQLVWETVQRHAIALQEESHIRLNQIRETKAMPLIEQSQWIAAAAACINPVPSLDVLATAAVNVQLVVDLSRVYQQPFSLEQAKNVAGILAGLIVKLGLVELSTQAIAAVLKSNTLTYLAGGVIQGVSAAYLTRVAGMALMQYFAAQSPLAKSAQPLNENQLQAGLQAAFDSTQKVTLLKGFVGQAMNKLRQTPEVKGLVNVEPS